MKYKKCIFGLLLAVGACGFAAAIDSRSKSQATACSEETQLEPYKLEMLDLAFEAASAMPVLPHIKNRSRAQEEVVVTCLELEQPTIALRYVEHIDNWRRGAAYADVGSYLAQHGTMKEKVKPYLDKAAQEAGRTEGWRKDRIRVKIARAYTFLQQHQQAQSFTADLEESEASAAARVEAMVCPKDSFEQQMKDLDALVSEKNFDTARNALSAYSELYEGFYTNDKQRELIEEKIRTSWEIMPIFIRINLLMELADSSISHSEPAKALELIDEAGEMMGSANWQLRFEIPLRAALSGLRFRAGDEDKARTGVEHALNKFDKNRKKVVNIYRAGILRSIAEAYQAMGDTGTARSIYERALEAGIENPNSRPRAEDLTATCCSMALYAVEPNAELWNLIRRIHSNLGDPW